MPRSSITLAGESNIDRKKDGPADCGVLAEQGFYSCTSSIWCLAGFERIVRPITLKTMNHILALRMIYLDSCKEPVNHAHGEP